MSSAVEECARRGSVQLPPAFSLLMAPTGTCAFTFACRDAASHGAGTLIWADDPDHLDFAVVLEPDEPLATARRAFFIGMSALIHAIAAVAPPDKPLLVDWPDTVRFDGARLGGGRLGWPEDADADSVPQFLVFGATLIISKNRAGDPGLTPGSTSFVEEGFEPDSEGAILETFARYLMRGFDAWNEESFEAAALPYLERLSEADCRRWVIDGVGDLVPLDGTAGRRELGPLLGAPTWLDPRTGMPRL